MPALYTLASGKVGKLMKVTYYRCCGIPLSAVAAAFFVERLADLGVFVCIALVFLGLQAKGPGTILVIAGLCVPVVLFVVSVLDAGQLSRTFRVAFVRKLRFDAVADAIVNAALSAKRFLTLRWLSGGILLDFLDWGAECTTPFVLAQIVPPNPIGLGDSTEIYVVAIVVGAISFLPGGLNTTDALLLTLVAPVLTLWFAVGLRWAAVGALRVSRQEAAQ